jgi:hypothetical protein
MLDQDSKTIYIYDVNTNIWSKEPQGNSKFTTIQTCNSKYYFINTGFSVSQCNTTVQNNQYMWDLEPATYPQNLIIQKNKMSNTTSDLSIPTTHKPYNAFGNSSFDTKYAINNYIFDGSTLWIGSNLGLVAYSPNTEKYHLMGDYSDLIDTNIMNIVNDDNILYVETSYGFNVITFK